MPWFLRPISNPANVSFYDLGQNFSLPFRLLFCYVRTEIQDTLGALWSLINICRLLWDSQRKPLTEMDSFSQCTYTLSTNTFCKPYPEARSRDHRLHILFNLLPSTYYWLHAWVGTITAQPFPFMCICKLLQTVKKAWSDIDPWGSTGLPTLPKLGFAGCQLSCHQPNVVICSLSYWCSTRQWCEGKETSN